MKMAEDGISAWLNSQCFVLGLWERILGERKMIVASSNC
ncbi:hypothetical protein YPPY47_1184 [Yersinia pestis PY-47]|nr:hypothetical protein YpAngola_A3348 [Yersinia pestis Angola]EIQ93511.1 hypothetical protein YPPY02_1064 [Yersinia pestis PY-02]EIR07680.1 hypothetical protein YPPY05_1078 [Yersinia pestis PY-05]EIR10639.1 hypothetical protein YPPY06_1107 [Yersinia pestis PY-06]EIR22572.1 hypothetical protein YPPY08_1119 [Yersinia pestis PY-08]EIR50992.1 hypothetical protein YPPY15_1091 [Yersinia pestis PY-15]EIR68375.1 hypothetical protein YPPY25_1129 [Yersinia pestis PY-25]EIR81974.1 hypothetical protein